MMPIRAVLLDVDGTLYHAGALRRRMFATLALSAVVRPLRTQRAIRHIRGYRTALEEMRREAPTTASIADLHLERAAHHAGDDVAPVRASVTEWMLERPLRHLAACRRAGAVEFLQALRHRGIPIGFFSDYPVAAKLAALGLSQFGTLTLCGADPEINAYKPWPHGYRRASELLGLNPEQVLYVGDRVEVDAAGAAAAGMRSVILTSRRSLAESQECTILATFQELGKHFERERLL